MQNPIRHWKEASKVEVLTNLGILFRDQGGSGGGVGVRGVERQRTTRWNLPQAFSFNHESTPKVGFYPYFTHEETEAKRS